MEKEEPFIHWQAKSHHEHLRSRDWYFATGLISIALIGLSLILRNFLFTLFLIIATAVFFMESNRPAKMISFFIERRGLRRGSVLFPYQNLESFWVREEGQYRELALRSHHTFASRIIFPLSEEVRAREIIEILRDFLPEIPDEKNALERLSDFLGF